MYKRQVLSLLLSLGSFSGSGLIGGHAGLDFLNRLFDFGNVLDILDVYKRQFGADVIRIDQNCQFQILHHSLTSLPV